MAVKAKFYVASVTRYGYPNGTGGWANPAPGGEVVLRPAAGLGNEEWASATPAGEFKMTVRQGDSFEWFADRLAKYISITLGDFEEA